LLILFSDIFHSFPFLARIFMLTLQLPLCQNTKRTLTRFANVTADPADSPEAEEQKDDQFWSNE
jgi:hypothetical protein